MDRDFVNRLAAEFSRQLALWIGPDDLAEAVARNDAEELAGVCHSHDFCDANEIMLAAWLELDPAADVALLVAGEQGAAEWFAAWNLAKAADFDGEQLQADIDYEKGMRG